MRRLLVGALLAASLGGLGAGSASAYCDPKYWPLCTNDCEMDPPDWDPRDPVRSLVKACPA